MEAVGVDGYQSEIAFLKGQRQFGDGFTKDLLGLDLAFWVEDLNLQQPLDGNRGLDLEIIETQIAVGV